MSEANEGDRVLNERLLGIEWRQQQLAEVTHQNSATSSPTIDPLDRFLSSIVVTTSLPSILLFGVREPTSATPLTGAAILWAVAGGGVCARPGDVADARTRVGEADHPAEVEDADDDVAEVRVHEVLGQFADQFVPGFCLILHHGSDSFICQKMALGLQKGSATQASQK